MRRGFLSLSARVVVNVEAMNMVEAIGNVVRHRKASVVYKLGGRYEVRTVPVISGEALRHALQAALVDVATSAGLPVCGWCRRYEFVKRGVVTDEFFGDLGGVESFRKVASANIYDAERLVMERCVVEDLGGFLIPTEPPVKRTSVFEVGFMVPVVVGDRVAYGFDVQFHVRHAPGAQAMVRRSREENQPQSIYNVESSSAIYAVGVNVELWRIGVASDGTSVGNRDARVKAALAALASVLNGDVRIGGHWSSYKPFWSLESAVAVFSSPLPISAAPAVGEGYIEETVKLAKAKKEVYGRVVNDVDYRILALGGGVQVEGGGGQGEVVEVVKEVPDFLKRLVEYGLEFGGVAGEEK